VGDFDAAFRAGFLKRGYVTEKILKTLVTKAPKATALVAGGAVGGHILTREVDSVKKVDLGPLKAQARRRHMDRYGS